MMTEVFERHESAVRSYCRSFPAVFNRASGAFMYDEDGREYIDFFCGAGALNLGHNHPRLKSKIIDFLQSDSIAHALDLHTVVKRDFIEKFQSEILAKRGLNYKLQFTGPTGTNAVEAALKLARKVKKRHKVFAFTGAFHGMTLGALALTSDRASRAGSGVTLDNVVRIPVPWMFPRVDTMSYLTTLIENDHSGIDLPAAIIIETVQAEGGIHPLGDEYLQQLRKLCDEHDILLIVDDIQVGIHRCGSYFSFESSGIVPDMVVLSKSLSGYGFPMSLLLAKPELDIWTPGEHNGTFRGNQIAFVSATEAIDVIRDSDTENEVKRKSAIISEYLNKNIANEKIEVRGQGMIFGIDLSAYSDIKPIRRKCFDNKLILETAGVGDKVLKIMPPLVIDDETLVRGLDIIRDAIRSEK